MECVDSHDSFRYDSPFASLETCETGGETITALLLYLNLALDSDNPYSSMNDCKALGGSFTIVSATACSIVVSVFPSEAGLGFFRCFKISGLGMTEPDARLPLVTLTFDPSSRYRHDTLTGAFVTGSIKLTFEYDMGDSTLTKPPGFSCVFLTARLFYRNHHGYHQSLKSVIKRQDVVVPSSVPRRLLEGMYHLELLSSLCPSLRHPSQL